MAELARLIGDEDPFTDFSELPPVSQRTARGAAAVGRRAVAEPPRKEPGFGEWPASGGQDVDLPPLRYGRRPLPPEQPAADDDRDYGDEVPASEAYGARSYADDDFDRSVTARQPAWDDEPVDESIASGTAPAAAPEPQTYDSRIRRAGAALSGGSGPLARLGSVRDSLMKAPSAPARPALPSLSEPPAGTASSFASRDLAGTRERLAQPPSELLRNPPVAAVKNGYGSLSRPVPAAPATDFDEDEGSGAAADDIRARLRRPSAYDDADEHEAPVARGRESAARYDRAALDRADDGRSGYDGSDYDRTDDDRNDDRAGYGHGAYDRRDYAPSEDTHGADEQAAAYAYSAERNDDGQDYGYDDYDEEYDPQFAEDGYMPPHGEEVYDSEPRKRRGRMALLLVASAVGLVLVGTAGVFAYRMALGPARTASTGDMPPVIRADSAPSKITSTQPSPTAPPGEAQAKLIYDQVGSDATGKEKMVPREEQPVDVTTAASAPAPDAGDAGAADTTGSTGSANATEPKRVRTLTVRADGSIAPSGTPDVGASVASYAATQQNPIPTGLPTPKTVTTVPATSSGESRPAAPVQQANAHGSTSDAPASTASGAYVVQVASQRSQADAMGSWRALQARYPNLLGTYQATVKRADLGERGIYYRAQVGPFASRDQANNLCQALRAQGGDCMVTRN